MQTQWTDRPVVDNHFSRVGKVTDVVYGDGSARPEWALVKTGPLASERLAPLDGASPSSAQPKTTGRAGGARNTMPVM